MYVILKMRCGLAMRSIEELKKYVAQNTTLDNLIEAIIYKSKQEKIPKSQAFIQQAFYNLKKIFPQLLNDLIFDESGVTPFSNELDSVLFRMEASAILSTLNPTYKNYIITNTPEHLEKSYNKLSNEVLGDIDRSADLFSNMVNEQLRY